MLNWSKRFNIFCFLDNCDYNLQPHHFDCALAAGASAQVEGNNLAQLDAFLDGPQWSFGHFSYELNHELFGLPQRPLDPVGFSPFFFFNPQILLLLNGHHLSVIAPDPDAVYHAVMAEDTVMEDASPVQVRARFSREEYLSRLKALQEHILRGDCYEVNFCQEFFAEGVAADPQRLFSRLTLISPNPFSALYRVNDQYLICASPERFMCKGDDHVLSQPMKGTIRRNLADDVADKALRNELAQSAKDRSENVMVVDLVRNDLSKICRDASVQVDELFGVYAYPQVYQMISTISGKLDLGVSVGRIMEAVFPMGSMTGAPKKRVMELINSFEPVKRGLFSGSVGYVEPRGNFDFNVVIRSLLYNAASGYLSYQVGSGITFYSDPEKEWEECLLKAEAIKKVLTGGASTFR